MGQIDPRHHAGRENLLEDRNFESRLPIFKFDDFLLEEILRHSIPNQISL